MSTKKLSATQRKIFEIIKNFENSKPIFQKFQPFDFHCRNDSCSSFLFEKKRRQVKAWPQKDNSYYIFCPSCGVEEVLSSKDVKKHKQRKPDDNIFYDDDYDNMIDFKRVRKFL